jgi:Protein of unknown function (DUF3617)
LTHPSSGTRHALHKTYARAIEGVIACPDGGQNGETAKTNRAHEHKEGEHVRQTTVLGTVLAGFLTVAFPQNIQPLRASTGLWEMTETVTWTGLPPNLPPELATIMAMANGRTHNYTTCVKTEDLRSNPWTQGSDEKCTWMVLSSTATDMDVKGVGCDIGMEGMTAEVHGKIHLVDAKDGTGSFEVSLSGNGQTLTGHSSFTGKWVSATCPAE